MTLDQIEHQAKNRLYIDPDAILRLVADLRRYRKALEWYARVTIYWGNGKLEPSEIAQDSGYRARAALEGERDAELKPLVNR